MNEFAGGRKVGDGPREGHIVMVMSWGYSHVCLSMAWGQISDSQGKRGNTGLFDLVNDKMQRLGSSSSFGELYSYKW